MNTVWPNVLVLVDLRSERQPSEPIGKCTCGNSRAWLMQYFDLVLLLMSS